MTRDLASTAGDVHNSAKRGRPRRGTPKFFFSKRDKKIKNRGLALIEKLEKMQLKYDIPKSHQYMNFKLNSKKVCVLRALKDRLKITYESKDPPMVDSKFVYRTNDNKYASDIKTDVDVNKVVSILKNICKTKILEPQVSGVISVTEPSTRDISSNNASGTSKSKEQKHGKKSNIKLEFHIEGMKFQPDSAIEAIRKIIAYLSRVDKHFLEKFEKMEHGKKRKYVSKDRNSLYPDRPDLYKHIYEIPTAKGWYLGTNYNTDTLLKIAALAKAATEPKIRNTMTGSIFDLYSPSSGTKNTKLQDTDRVVSATPNRHDNGDYEKPTSNNKIPSSENVKNEFKLSFVYNYKAAKFEKDGNKKAMRREEERVKKTNHGFGLEWDIAKAIAGFSNSSIDGGGQLWVGLSDDGAILGLEPDFKKYGKKSWEDKFRIWINDKIEGCIEHYKAFTNIQLLFLNQHNKKICKFVIKPGTSPMFLHHKGDKNKQIFYRRNHNAPKTEELNLKEGWTYIRDRFPDYKPS